ncbi:MAG: protein kinase [Planctomycetes bacterium]|nr:protein kinase [Planctomycetota bacterium]
MRPLLPGTPLGPYVVQAELGRGGMGTVYRAARAADGAALALKVLAQGSSGAPAERRLRFQREAELAARLAHPGIVRVHDVGEAGGRSYIAMDLIEGEPLSARVGRLAPLDAARLVAQVARAVAHAHAHGVVHRDLKPDNVLVRPDGTAVVTDFGVARAEGSDALTRTGALVGTPTYLAPEQVTGAPATAASDVHALGAVLHEAITGAPPFVRDDLGALLAAIADEAPRPPSRTAQHVPGALDRLVLAALAKDPARRPTAEALAAGLEAVVEGRPAAAGGRALVALAAGALLLGAVALAHAAGRGRAPDPVPRPAAAAPPPAPTPTAAPAAAPSPAWLAPLLARPDLPRLQAALDEVARTPLAPADRARLIAVLADLDARWVDPGPGFSAEARRSIDLLLWTNALWRRLDPEHRPRAERASLLLDSAAFVAGSTPDRRHAASVARALVALDPEHVGGYLALAAVAHADDRDPELVRVGAELARRQGEHQARGVLLNACVGWLAELARPGDAAIAARLLDVAREVIDDDDLPGSALANVIFKAVDFAPPAERARWLDRAVAVAPDSLNALSARGWLRLRAGDEAGALADGEAALRALGDEVEPTYGQVQRAVGLVSELHTRAGRPREALAAVERGLAVPGHPRPALALRRATLLAASGAPAAALREALEDLRARLERHAPGARERHASPQDLALLARMEAAIRELARAATLDADAALQALAPWETEEAQRVLDM